MCACASPASLPPERAAFLASNLNWDFLLNLAETHRVLGIVAARLKKAGFPGVPEEAREKLQARMRAQHLFTLGMTAELFHILDEFARAGIEVLLVKGPLVSLLAYGDPARRSYVDLDLIVRHDAVLRASRIISESGFDPDVPEKTIQAGKIPGEYLFTRRDTPQMIELHTEKTFRYYPLPMPIDDLFARQRRVFLDGREVPALSLEDEFVLNCIHGAKHFWERLMWPADIAAIASRQGEISWERVMRAAKDVGAERMVRVALLLSEHLLGAAFPASMAAGAHADGTAMELVKQIEGWLPSGGYAPPALPRRAMFRFRMGGGGLAGIAYLLRLSFSPTEEDWSAEDRSSKFWGAVKRPFRLIRKYGQD